MPLLREQIVYLDLSDARGAHVDPARYFAAARAARTLVAHELGWLAMKHFDLPGAPALQTTAENIYFETYGYFADLDGSGHAATAQALADALISRARSHAA